MVISSYMIRNRSFRRTLSPDEIFRLDEKKTPSQNAYTIYTGLSNKKTSDCLRLCYLNEAVKLFDRHKPASLGFTVDEFLYCFSASLTHQQCQVRAGALRGIRHLLAHSKNLHKFNEMQIPLLVCRSLDIVLQNDDERLQALKLIRKLLAVAPEQINPLIVNCLVSLAESGSEDRILRACLAILCEFGVLVPSLLIMCGGVSAITRNVLETQSPRIAESLVGVLLHLLEWPHTRSLAGVRLDCLAAPYCDFTYRLGIMDKNKDARDLRFTCSRITLLSVLKSWAGIIEFCNPHNPSGLKAIIDILYLNQVEVRKAILDLLYEVIGLSQPPWTEDYSVALQVIDPADFQDAWRLTDGFVAVEGRSVLPSLATSVPNITEIHLALLLYCFVENGLLNALVQVICSSDACLSVRATILLGKLLQLMHTLLPADVYNTNHCLPTLIMKAAEGNHQAKMAITALQSYHQILRNRPASCTLFLDTIIQSGTLIHTRMFNREINTKDSFAIPKKRLTFERRKRYDSVGSSSLNEEEGKEKKRNKLLQFFDNIKENEKLIRDSTVLTSDSSNWDWDIVVTLLRSDLLGKMDELTSKFIKTLVAYFKPSNNKFSHEDLTVNRQAPPFVIAGLELIEWLLRSSRELDCIRLLTDLFTDISGQLLSISTSRSAHDCLFSPAHMANTMCMMYFIFIGRMCKHESGINVLNNTDVFKQLSNLVSNTAHVCYVKLIVSGLDYKLSTPQRILALSLTKSPHRAARHYATQFLLVLLRAKIPNFEVWGMPLVIEQLRDKERLISLTALDILLEACHDKLYLEEIILCWPEEALLALGDEGRLVMTKFYAIPRGLNHTKARVKEVIQEWVEVFNKRYVLMLEADTHASLTLHTRNEDKTYSKRTCSNRPTIVPPNILPHLYGQLVQTFQGMSNLQKYGDIPHHLETLDKARCQNEEEVLNLKTSLWALGHISSSAEGLEFLNDPVSRVYEKIIYLAKNSPMYSIRATSLNVLGLVGCTKMGADLLYKLDWLCVRHDRNTFWPVYEPEDWLSKQLTPVRHQIDRVPPYNYTALEEMNGNVSFYFDDTIAETGNLSADLKSIDEPDTVTPTGVPQKSRTLPDKNMLVRQMKAKHMRSMSESKTADSLSIMNHPDFTHRKRFNSGTTDSNTSGVSSCDSVVGRQYGDPITQNTLSPIPSSSNLMEFRRPKPRMRRISVTGVPLNDQGPSIQDIRGMYTFRSIRNNRPVLENSSDSTIVAVTSGSDVSESAKKRPPPYGQSKSLERHSSTVSSYEEFRTSLLSARLLQPSDSKGPCYIGVCLPKYIHDLFPTWSPTSTYVSSCLIGDQAANDLSMPLPLNQSSDHLNETTGSEAPVVLESMSDIGLISSMSDISSTSKKYSKTVKHDRNECLHCSRNKSSRINSDLSISRKRSSGSVVPPLDVSYNSPESVFSEDSTADRTSAKIMQHVQRMANFGWIKQSKQALLELKQKHPQSFQDLCLYSEVCKSLGRNTFRAGARRFIQEIFYDLDFDSFYIDANEILMRKDVLGDEVLEIVEDSTSDPALPLTTTTFKTHFKASALASVYEASSENLSESLSKSSKSVLQVPPDDPRVSTIPSPSLSPVASSSRTLPSRTTTETANLNSTSRTSMQHQMRPRFNTFEFDLSCSKNKFPIRDRSNLSQSVGSRGSNYQSQNLFSSEDRPPTATTPIGSLYCEQRLLKSSRSEQTLSSRWESKK